MQWKPEDVVWAVPEKGLYLCVAGYFQMRLDAQKGRPTCQDALLLKGMGQNGAAEALGVLFVSDAVTAGVGHRAARQVPRSLAPVQSITHGVMLDETLHFPQTPLNNL